MWRAQSKLEKLEVIYFDAYAADYLSEPFVSFSGEILELVNERLSEGKSLTERQQFKNNLRIVARFSSGSVSAPSSSPRRHTLVNLNRRQITQPRLHRIWILTEHTDITAKPVEQQNL